MLYGKVIYDYYRLGTSCTASALYFPPSQASFKSRLYFSQPALVFFFIPIALDNAPSPIKKPKAPVKFSSCVNFVPPWIVVLDSNLNAWEAVKMTGSEAPQENSVEVLSYSRR